MIIKNLILITLMITSYLTIHLNTICPKVFERLSPCGVVISTQIPRGFYAYKKMEKEIWKDVIGYEGCYQVSNKGRVYRLCSPNTHSNPPSMQ